MLMSRIPQHVCFMSRWVLLWRVGLKQTMRGGLSHFYICVREQPVDRKAGMPNEALERKREKPGLFWETVQINSLAHQKTVRRMGSIADPVVKAVASVGLYQCCRTALGEGSGAAAVDG